MTTAAAQLSKALGLPANAIGADVRLRPGEPIDQIQAALDFDARPRYARNSETGRAAQASAEPKAGTKRMRPTESLITRARDSGRRRATLGGDMAVVWEAC